MDKERLEKFRASLNQDILYKVESANYTHCRAEDMSYADLQKLLEKSQLRGEASLTEGHIANFNNLIL